MTTATVRSMSGPRSTLQARIAECPHLPAFCTLELLNLASETPGWDGGIWSPSPSAALTCVYLLPTASWCDEEPGRGHQWVSWFANVLRPPLPVMPSLALFQGEGRAEQWSAAGLRLKLYLLGLASQQPAPPPGVWGRLTEWMNSGGNRLGVQLGCSPSVWPGPCAPREILREGHWGPKQGRGFLESHCQAQMGTQAPYFCPDLSLLFFFFFNFKVFNLRYY